MIKANHHLIYVFFFKVYVKILMYWHFREVNLVGNLEDNRRPVLVIGNHFSWWDGFVVLFFNYKILHRKFHVMMLEEQLETRKFLSRAGAFSIKKGSRSMITTLQYASNLLNDSGNMLLYFPQGKFESKYKQPLSFEPGIEKLLEMNKFQAEVVFLVMLIDYFSHRRPTLNIYYTSFPVSRYLSGMIIEEEFNAFYQNCISQQNEYE